MLKARLELLKRNIAEGVEINLRGGASGSFVCSACRQEGPAEYMLKKKHKALCLNCFFRSAAKRLAGRNRTKKEK